jgi:hypothetical protein
VGLAPQDYLNFFRGFLQTAFSMHFGVVGVDAADSIGFKVS